MQIAQPSILENQDLPGSEVKNREQVPQEQQLDSHRRDFCKEQEESNVTCSPSFLDLSEHR